MGFHHIKIKWPNDILVNGMKVAGLLNEMTAETYRVSFVVLGIAAMNMQGLQGASYQMLAHGVSTGALFGLVGMLSDRRHTRLIEEFGLQYAPLRQRVKEVINDIRAGEGLPLVG